MLHVDDARAGREFLRRLTPHVDSAADWWQADEPGSRSRSPTPGWWRWACRRTHCRASPKRSGSGWPRAPDKLLDYGANDPKHWEPPFGSGQIHIGVSVFSDSEETWRRTMDTARRAVRGTSRPHGADDAGLRRPAGRPQPARLQGLDRSARDRGQRRRAAARSGTGDQGRRVHPRLPGRGRRAAAGATAGRARTQRHLRRAAQVPVARRDVQPLPAGERPDRRRAGAARGEAGRALAQRRAADARARRRTTRRSAPTRCATTTSRTPPIRTAGRCRSARTCGA